MSPFEGIHLNEAENNSEHQTIEAYRKSFTEKILAITNHLESERNVAVLEQFKDLCNEVEEINDSALLSLESELKHANSLNSSVVKQKKVEFAKAAYERINDVNLSRVELFLKRYNI
jgi:hypothetical protein